MRLAIGTLLLTLGGLVDSSVAQDDTGSDCGTNTGSTYYEACVSAKHREIREQDLAKKYEEIVQSLSGQGQERIRGLFVKAQEAWVAYRDATCELENDGINSIGWARCYGRLLDERIEYFESRSFY
jgi:uncharacterized protein YecT (DUF1311 family)